MTQERRSETPVVDTKLRSEISVSVFLQGAMLLVLSGIGALLWDINSSIGELKIGQRVATEQLSAVKAEVAALREGYTMHDGRIRVLEIGQAKRSSE